MCGPLRLFHGPVRRGGSVGEPRLRASIAQAVGEAGVGDCGQRQWAIEPSDNKRERN